MHQNTQTSCMGAEVIASSSLISNIAVSSISFGGLFTKDPSLAHCSKNKEKLATLQGHYYHCYTACHSELTLFCQLFGNTSSWHTQLTGYAGNPAKSVPWSFFSPLNSQPLLGQVTRWNAPFTIWSCIYKGYIYAITPSKEEQGCRWPTL